jgi:hypothetical protein
MDRATTNQKGETKMTRIAKTKIQMVNFRAYDDRTYKAHTCGVKNNIATVCYKHPDGMITAYLPKSEWNRLTKRNR